jgi:hypothetical protein
MDARKVFLVTIESWPCPGSHYLHTKKFLQAFESHGFEYHEISNLEEIEMVKPGDIVYLSNHGFSVGDIPFELLDKIGKRGGFYILWYWHDHLELADNLFGDRYILTGEHFYDKPKLVDHVRCWNIQQQISNFVPLTFASNLHPDDIGNLDRSDKYLAHFVGNGYQKQINNKLRVRFRGIKIVNTPPFISENSRTEIFLSSKVALGWHSEGNIENHVVVERVFEGLAFGNVVISDTPTAFEITEGIVEFADSYEMTRDIINRVRKDEKFRVKKMELGFEWAKAHGTYWHVARNFIDRFQGKIE